MPAPGETSSSSSATWQLGKYAVRREIGRGGMGIVYEAVDTRLERPVVLKLLADHLAEDADARRRFVREARAAAALGHPNVVVTHDVESEGETVYIAMEFVPHGSVADWVGERGPLPWPIATRIAIDVARALAAAHAVEIVHRDVKPSNVLLARSRDAFTDPASVMAILASPEPLAKLSDFGLVKSMGHGESTLTGERQSVGTPHYLSPEQARAETVDARSDLYSLGATYFALVTGRPPYVAESPLQVLFAHCSRPVPDPRQHSERLPDQVAKTVARAMAKEPIDRHDSAEAFLADLESLLRTACIADLEPEVATTPTLDDASTRLTEHFEATVVTPETSPVTTTRPVPRPRRVTLVAAFILAIAVAGAVAPQFWPETNGAPDVPETGRDHAASTVRVPWPKRPRDFDYRKLGELNTVALSRDWRYILVGSALGREQFGHFEIHDLVEDETILEHDLTHTTYSGAHASAFLPDGSAAVVTVHSRMLWLDLATQAVTTILVDRNGSLYNVVTAPEGQRVAVAVAPFQRDAPPRVELFDVDSVGDTPTIGRRRSLEGPVGTLIHRLAYSHDGRTLAVADSAGSVRLYAMPGAELVRELTIPKAHHDPSSLGRSLAFTPDNTRLAVGAKSAVLVFDVETGNDEVMAREHRSPVYYVDFTPNGRFLASSSFNRVLVHDARTGELVADPPTGHDGIVSFVAIEPGRPFFVSAAFDARVRFADNPLADVER